MYLGRTGVCPILAHLHNLFTSSHLYLFFFLSSLTPVFSLPFLPSLYSSLPSFLYLVFTSPFLPLLAISLYLSPFLTHTLPTLLIYLHTFPSYLYFLQSHPITYKPHPVSTLTHPHTSSHTLTHPHTPFQSPQKSTVTLFEVVKCDVQVYQDCFYL